jgi:hypothetical protein
MATMSRVYDYHSFLPPPTARPTSRSEIHNPGYLEWEDSHGYRTVLIGEETRNPGPEVRAAVMCQRYGHQLDGLLVETRVRDDVGMTAVMGWMGRKKCHRCARVVKA